jgi:hypothetical protein
MKNLSYVMLKVGALLLAPAPPIVIAEPYTAYGQQHYDKYSRACHLFASLSLLMASSTESILVETLASSVLIVEI